MILINLFLSLSLGPVSPKATTDCWNGDQQWLTQSEVANLIIVSSDWSQTKKNEVGHLHQQVCIPVGCNQPMVDCLSSRGASILRGCIPPDALPPPPTPTPDGQTNASENIIFPQLHVQAVTIKNAVGYC